MIASSVIALSSTVPQMRADADSSRAPVGRRSRAVRAVDRADIFGDTYTADLTKGSGDFVVGDAGTYSTNYQPDGFHLVVKEPETWGPTGVKASLQHSVLSVKIAVTRTDAPPDASVGPFCWQNPTHGYGFVVSGSGAVRLVQVSGSYSRVRVLRSKQVEAAKTDAPMRLMITCTRTEPVGRAKVRLGGYVDGSRKVVATAKAVSYFQYTGFAGHTTSAAPAEWSISKFWRRGPADMPRNTPK